MSDPLVTCIMPTYNRQRFIPDAIRYFLRQDYPNLELVVVDDSARPARDVVPDHPRIKYVRFDRRVPIGDKRNIAIESGSGEIVIHWDDDDWHGSQRVSYQARELLAARATDPNIGMCGMTLGYAYLAAGAPEKGRAFIFGGDTPYGPGRVPQLFGGSFCYTRDFWAGIRFPSVKYAEDPAFLRLCPHGTVVQLPERCHYIYIRHNANSWRMPMGRMGGWDEVRIETLRSIMGEDFAYYQQEGHAMPTYKIQLSHDWNRHKGGETQPRANDIITVTDGELDTLRSRRKRYDRVITDEEVGTPPTVPDGMEAMPGTRAVKIGGPAPANAEAGEAPTPTTDTAKKTTL